MHFIPCHGKVTYPHITHTNTFMIPYTKMHWLLVSYFFVLLLLAPYHILGFDTYYYWDWSRHLAASYYDGPPLIAYCIKAFTLVFGNTLFALGCLGIISVGLTGLILYQTARLFLTQHASCIAMLVWLSSPNVALDLLHHTMYDSPFTLFWALTLYYAIKYIKFNRVLTLYQTAASIGLMLLSKYSGIILILAFALFLAFSTHRRLWRSPHLYGAMLLALIIFSPVLWWNYHHHWVSFFYQLSTHQIHTTTSPLFNLSRSLFTVFLPTLNVMLFVPLLLIKTTLTGHAAPHAEKTTRSIEALCLIVSLTCLGFYMMLASYATIRPIWLHQYLLTTSLLVGACYQEKYYQRPILALIGLYFTISIGIMGVMTFMPNTKNHAYHHKIMLLNQLLTPLPAQVFTSSWLNARLLFFLGNKPQIYTLACNQNQNQYALWSLALQKKIQNHTVKSIFYIGSTPEEECLKHYFSYCEPVEQARLAKPGDPTPLFVFHCYNR